MQPRYEPTYNPTGNEEFLGYAGELDVWAEKSDRGERWIVLIGPEDRRIEGVESVHNFDVYVVEEGMLSSKFIEQDGKDVHVELPEMCQVYQLCVERGYITTE
jgi:hypothetical protein